MERNPAAVEAAAVRVEVVRGKLDGPTSERLLEFWTSHGALDEATARERLAQVVCVLYDEADEIVGVNSAYAATAPLVGRPFWIYRRFLRPGVAVEDEMAMIAAAYETLAAEFDSGADRPVGLCLVVSDPALIAAHPEAIWPDLDLQFAGYTNEGAQVRIRYFPGALI